MSDHKKNTVAVSLDLQRAALNRLNHSKLFSDDMRTSRELCISDAMTLLVESIELLNKFKAVE